VALLIFLTMSTANGSATNRYSQKRCESQLRLLEIYGSACGIAFARREAIPLWLGSGVHPRPIGEAQVQNLHDSAVVQGLTRSLLALGLTGGLLLRQKARRRIDLVGQVAVVTGGSRGLGYLLARELIHKGCRVAICARDVETLERARYRLERVTGASVLAVPCDVSDELQVTFLIRQVREHLGSVDILVNNAGIIQVGPVETMTADDFRQAMDVMYWGVVYPTLAVLPEMVHRRHGHILNVTSIGGKVSVPHILPYSGAKFAAVGFSQGLAAEARRHCIKVTNLSPGLMRTGSHLHAQFKGNQANELTWFGLSASAPLIAMDAERAARQAISALERGEPDRVLSIPAVTLATVHGLFPGLTVDLLSLVNRFLLPRTGSRDTSSREGVAIPRSGSAWFQAVTRLGRSAAGRFNQVPDGRHSRDRVAAR
jgi:short-subunit dehydrogenase